MKVHFEPVARSTSLAISLVRLLRKYYSHLHLKEWLLMKLKCNLLSFHLRHLLRILFFTFLLYLIIHFVPTNDASSFLIARRVEGKAEARWRLTQSQNNKLISKKAITRPALWRDSFALKQGRDPPIGVYFLNWPRKFMARLRQIKASLYIK